MANAAHNTRKNRESVSKRIGSAATKWIWDRDGHSCAYCGCSLVPGRGAHLDHLEPHAHGGEDTVINLVLSCERCNSARQDMSLRQWSDYAAEVYGLRFSPACIKRRAASPVPASYIGRGRAWNGASLAS